MNRRQWEKLTPEQRRERLKASMRSFARSVALAGVASAEAAQAMRELADQFHVEKVAHLLAEEHLADPAFQRRVLEARAHDPETGLAGHMLEVAAEMWPDD